MFGTKIEKVIVEKINLDFECMYDLSVGRGIRLRSTESFKKEMETNAEDKRVKINSKIHDGLQSSFFGTDFADDNAFEERYSCKCKKYIGKMYENMVCDQCDHMIEYVDTDMTKTGWIMLDHFKVISPIFVMKLIEALGSYESEKILFKILNSTFSSEEIIKEKELLEMKKIPYAKKGMRWLVDNIEEVITTYKKKKPGKAKLFDELLADRDKIFTSCIPVYSSVLRIENPGEKDKKLFTQKINTLYRSIIKSVGCINDFERPEEINEKNLHTVDRYLFAIQKEIVEVFNEIFKILNGKKGVINGRIISGRYNFSARNIIITNTRFLRCDEIELCYITFMELFRYELINMYAKLQGCSIVEAQNRWKRGLVNFDQTMYNIMLYMIKENKADINIMINRNPSINFGSFLTVKVAHVKENINDKTMTINTRVTTTMNADFDGDMLNIFRIVGLDMAKKFHKIMNPRYNLYINRLNGKVNPAMLPIKDELAGFFQFNNVYNE